MSENLTVAIAGGGRVGFKTAELLAEHGHDITIVESDPERCEAIADAWLATVIKGDATDPGILEQVPIGDADVVAGLTGKTGVNLAVCMMARELEPSVRTVARIDQAEVEGYTRFVDAIVYPEQAGARVAANEIVGSDVRTLADVTGTLVISDDDGERIARPETTLTAGKRYVVAVEPDVVDEVMQLMRG